MRNIFITLKIALLLSLVLNNFSVTASVNSKTKIVNDLFGTPPTSITGVTTICKGSSTTLTANGATLLSNDSYQWGTGTTIGSNIISGQTSATLVVTPIVTTTYWVRVIGSTTTSGVTKVVTVVNPSIAPTSVSGNLSICNGSSTTLSATGATLYSGAVYQWGT